MSIVVSLEAYRPAARYDGLPWTQARIEEAPASTGPWTVLETEALTPVDTDPERPAYRNFTTMGTVDAQWYRIVFLDAGANLGLPTVPVQNIEDDRPVYASWYELARILKIRTPSDEQIVAMDRVLAAAAGEINDEIDFTTLGLLDPRHRRLCQEINLQRGAELWKMEELQVGFIGVGSEFGPSHTARNTWDKYAYMLANVKQQWGFA